MHHQFTADFGIITHLSDSLQLVDLFVEHHIAFPCLSSLSNPVDYINQELIKLKSKSVRIFIVMHSSLDFAVILFEKAKELGMMEKGYVWIVLMKLQAFLILFHRLLCLICKVLLVSRTTMRIQVNLSEFRTRFRRMYRSKYPEKKNNRATIFTHFELMMQLGSLPRPCIITRKD